MEKEDTNLRDDHSEAPSIMIGINEPFMEGQEKMDDSLVSADDNAPMPGLCGYVMIFALLSMNEGLMMGYSAALVSLFTELEVPSDERSFLYAFTMASVFQMLAAPITDRYYSNKLGKRRSYLFFTKLIMASSYAVMALHINDLVDQKKVMTIAYFFMGLGLVMVFESNANAGLTVDFFGPKNSNAAAAAGTAASILGMTIGIQIFTSLNSHKICTEYLGMSKAFLDHRTFLLFIAGTNILSFCLLFLIKENPVDAGLVFTGMESAKNPFKVVKALFKVRRLRNFIIWTFIGPSFPATLMVVSSQYYIKKGLSREFLILLMGCIIIPYTVLSNTIWVNITKKGKLTVLLWMALGVATIAELLHVMNVKLFQPGENSGRTFISIAAITLFSSLSNWGMCQVAFMVSAAPKDKAATFLSTINSLYAVTRIPPAFLATYFMDKLEFMTLGGIILVLSTIFEISTYTVMKDVAVEDPTELGKQFDAELEADTS